MTEDATVIKRRKLNLNRHDASVNLSFLDDDSLRAILLRTRASDYPNLRTSYKSFCDVLDSTMDRKEMSNQVCVEVTHLNVEFVQMHLLE